MPVVVQVVVQHQRRLLREGLALLLFTARRPGADVVLLGAAERAEALVELCAHHRPDVAVLEVDAAPNPYRLSRQLRGAAPGLRIVGLCGPLSQLDHRQARTAGLRLVPSGAGFTEVLDAVLATDDTALTASVLTMPLIKTNGSSDAPPLTARETAILVLVGGGCTSQAISDQLRISPKTVENHKQRIFAKLGVQNQAHAVAVAIREGLITPDRMMSVVAD